MERASTVRPATPRPVEVRGSAPRGVVQRKCACAARSGAGGSCQECNKEAVSVQRYSIARQSPAMSILLAAGVSGNQAALEHSGAPGAVAGHSFGRVAVGSPWAPRAQEKSVPGQPGDGNDEQADQLARPITGDGGIDSGSRESV